MKELVIGIDDAGRGPLIGPMTLAGVLLTKDQESSLLNKNIRDSKTLSHSTRIRLSKLIKETAEAFHIVASSAETIDASIKKGTNLNTLEAQKTAEIINVLNKKSKKIEVVVDCPSINTQAWRAKLMEYIDSPENLEVKCEHKADANHLSAAAASILAKVRREEEISVLKSKFGDFGSGYPSDPKTKLFLKEKGQQFSNEGIFRKSWATWKKIYPEKEQASLKQF
jgi:ribonuclease HII